MPTVNERSKRSSLFAAWVVTLSVVGLNFGYAIAHNWDPSVELLAALLLVGGFTSGHVIDIRRKDKDDG